MRPTRLARVRKRSPLRTFALLSLVCLGALGAILGRQFARDNEHEARRDARSQAELLAETAFAPSLRASDLRGPLDPARKAQFDAIVRAARRTQGIARIKIWTRGGRIIYSDDPAAIGRRFEVEDDLREAFEGHTESGFASPGEAEHVTERHLGTLTETYVPLRLGGRVAGAFELYERYAPFASSLREKTHRAWLVLGLGLLILYAALYRLVARLSSDLRRQTDQARHEARHDALTALPNRRRLVLELERAIEASAGQAPGALLLVDLDGFKELNDTLGHDTGDALLRLSAERLRTEFADHLVARLGGDEFAVLIAPPAGAGAAGVAEQVMDAMTRPFDLDDLCVRTGASIGLSQFPEDGRSADRILAQAELAMYRAKRGLTGTERYDGTRDRRDPLAIRLGSELPAAVERGEIQLVFQPKWALPARTLCGAEALVRWRHPERGLLMPGVFLPAAEQSGTMRALTSRVLDTALGVAAGVACGDMAVNLSAQDLVDANLPAAVARALERHGLPASRLTLEITENLVTSEARRMAEVLRELHALGVRLALDDFGTGATSLTLLKTLPLDELKLDRSFVRDLAREPADRHVLEAVISLATGLGVTVVAEGVEDVESLDLLEELGCPQAQGFLLARPGPARVLAELAREQIWVPAIPDVPLPA